MIGLNNDPIIKSLIKLEAMLNGCYLLNRDKMLDDHIDKFELPNKRAVFFFQLLSFLGHKLLDVVVLFIGNF